MHPLLAVAAALLILQTGSVRAAPTNATVTDKDDTVSSLSPDTTESSRLAAEVKTTEEVSSQNVRDESTVSEAATTTTRSTQTNPSAETASHSSDESTDVIIPVSRYVPPLDPLKHMLMMAETRLSKNAESTSTTTQDAMSSEAPPELESEAESSAETTSEEAEVVSSSSEVTEDSKESNLPEHQLSTVSSTEETTTLLTERKEEISEKDVEGLPVVKSSELNLEGESVSSELSSESDTTESTFSSVATSTRVTATDVTENKESSSEEALVRSGDEQDIQPMTTAILTETSTIPKSESTSELASSAGTSSEVPEISSKSSEVTEEVSKDDVHDITEVVTMSSSTSVPETTLGERITTLAVDDAKNVSLEEELEFRAVKLPFNASKVSYSDAEHQENTRINDSLSESEVIYSDEKSTTFVPTTTAELLPSSTTATEKDTEASTGIEKLDSSPISSKDDAAVSISSGEISDAGAVLIKESADMLKVQSLSSGLDSVPAEESSTETSTTPEEELGTMLSSQTTKDDSTSVQPVSSTEVSTAEEREAQATSVSVSHETTFTPSTTKVPALENISESSEEDKSDPELEEKSSDREPESVEVTESPEEDVEIESLDHKDAIKDRYVSGNNTDMVAAVQFLHYHDKSSSEQCFKLVDAHWNYATNLTDENKKKQLSQTLEYSLFHKEAWRNATSFAWKSFNDTLLRRWFKSLSVLGTAALPEEKLNEFNRLKAEMKNTYSTAKICPYVAAEKKTELETAVEKDCSLTLEPDLQRILTKSRDYDELVHVWKSWRDAAGKPIREKFLRFVELSNEAAKMNGFSDTGDMWREAYESETFEADLEALWEQLRPLYEHLHAYVRRKLIRQYGNDKIKEDGPIPAHLLGSMWAQSWVSLLDVTQPFQGKPSVDVTPIMEKKNMTAVEMFKVSEEFFTSLGLKAMPDEFWKHSLIEKPTDREVICHASAWDFCNGKDYRIKQCTDITMEDLIVVHHEMGHIQYFLQYARQPNVFREGANPGFHEAIGDVLALSVSTPKHLQSIGLLEEFADDPEGDLNFLLRTALDKVAFLPSGYLIDLWRWGLFSGDIQPEEMNSRWWELRLKYQGICPPVKRTDSDFDPGAKYHVPGNVPYIRYFVSFVIQFQFHKVLCDAAGHTGPLYKCDIYRSKEAGQILSQVMELGSSEHWSEAMKIMTGGATNKMDAGPILEYFEPLLRFLQEQNGEEFLGWKSEDPTICP